MSQQVVLASSTQDQKMATCSPGAKIKSPASRSSFVVLVQKLLGRNSAVSNPGWANPQAQQAKPEQSVRQPQCVPVQLQPTCALTHSIPLAITSARLTHAKARTDSRLRRIISFIKLNYNLIINIQIKRRCKQLAAKLLNPSLVNTSLGQYQYIIS